MNSKCILSKGVVAAALLSEGYGLRATFAKVFEDLKIQIGAL